MSINKNKRLLTIGYQLEPRSQQYACRYHTPVPNLRLSGKWLGKAGFSRGDIVEVDVQDGCLIIRKTPNKWKIEVISKKWMLNESGDPIK